MKVRTSTASSNNSQTSVADIVRIEPKRNPHKSRLNPLTLLIMTTAAAIVAYKTTANAISPGNFPLTRNRSIKIAAIVTAINVVIVG